MSLNPQYINGITEMAGSFTYSRSVGGITIYFSIKALNKETHLLAEIKEYFNVGKIYKGKKGQDWIQFRVNKIGELIRIVKHFEKYPLKGTKQHVFEIWKQMIDCKRRKMESDKKKIGILAEKLSKRNNRS